MNVMTARSVAGNLFEDAVAASEADVDEYLRIGEVARTYGVTLRALRFYEDKGLLTPKREGTTRLYSREDRARLRMILLCRKVGFTLRDVKALIDLIDPEGPSARQLKLTLEKSTRQMGRLTRQREELEAAIVDLGKLIDRIREQLEAATPRV